MLGEISAIVRRISPTKPNTGLEVTTGCLGGSISMKPIKIRTFDLIELNDLLSKKNPMEFGVFGISYSSHLIRSIRFGKLDPPSL
jgi:hypothetical protein